MIKNINFPYFLISHFVFVLRGATGHSKFHGKINELRWQESCNKNIKHIVVYISFYHLRLIGIILRQLNIIVSHNTENCSCPIMQHSHILHTYSEGKVWLRNKTHRLPKIQSLFGIININNLGCLNIVRFYFIFPPCSCRDAVL